MNITAFLDEIAMWAAAQPDVVGVALVGSHAHGVATQESDVDVMILTTNIEKYFQSEAWASLFGQVEKADVEHWGVVETLRCFYKGGLELEFNFASPSWAGVPVDAGTRRVVSDGMRILLDSQSVLETLQREVGGSRHKDRS